MPGVNPNSTSASQQGASCTPATSVSLHVQRATFQHKHQPNARTPQRSAQTKTAPRSRLLQMGLIAARHLAMWRQVQVVSNQVNQVDPITLHAVPGKVLIGACSRILHAAMGMSRSNWEHQQCINLNHTTQLDKSPHKQQMSQQMPGHSNQIARCSVGRQTSPLLAHAQTHTDNDPTPLCSTFTEKEPIGCSYPTGASFSCTLNPYTQPRTPSSQQRCAQSTTCPTLL